MQQMKYRYSLHLTDILLARFTYVLLDGMVSYLRDLFEIRIKSIAAVLFQSPVLLLLMNTIR